MNLTNTMLTKIEALKDAYFTVIQERDAAGLDAGLECGQYRRLTAMIDYLEERAAR